jgi:ACR3 family arsenite transporter
MVIVWTDLSKGNLALGVSFVAWNSFIQIISTPMLVYLLARAGITINPLLILESVLLYLLLPLIAGILTRKFIQNKSYFKAFLKMLGNIQNIALLFTIVVIFWGEGQEFWDILYNMDDRHCDAHILFHTLSYWLFRFS